MANVRQEIQEKIVKEYASASKGGKTKLWEILDYENSFNLTYYGYCFNESLRYEPPVPFSSTITFSQDCQVGPYNILKDDMVFINMYHLHHSKE